MKWFGTLLILLLLLTGFYYWAAIEPLVIPADAVLPDGSSYRGEVENGLFHGEGELMGADNSRYVGTFKNGIFNGQGELWDVDGSYYKGAFQRGVFNGLGHFKYNDGTTYEGKFTNGQITGKGKMVDSSGDVYQGTFRQGMLTEGLMTDELGNQFDGVFEQWLLQGYGIFTGSDGTIYEGVFENGVLTGRGQIKSSEGNHYQGDIQDWIPEGNGKMVLADGSVYLGDFSYGEFHGEGTLTLKEPIDGISEVSGEWTYGTHPDDPRSTARNWESYAGAAKTLNESLLYNQNELLASIETQLQAADPNQVDVYFLGIAPHQQPVFYKEVSEIDQYLTPIIGPNKSALLLNHPDFSESHPLATHQSIQKTLDILAQKMDTQQDILVVYFSSHGLPEVLSVEYDGLDLPQMQAETISQMLNDSPIESKVIIISACYSGSFLPELVNDHHLIMTAARDDRTSFGCGEDSEMTYFGKALFREALPKHHQLIDAFEVAKAIIETWENEDFPDAAHSEPQISVGYKIDQKLANHPKLFKR